MGRIKYFLIRIKNLKRISWVIIIILLLSFNTYRRSPYTYKKDHRPLNYALKGHRRNFKTHYVRKSESDYKNAYHIQVKNKANAEEFIEIILSIDEYLAKSPDHQPSDYATEVIFRNTISGKPPILKFSNVYSEGAYKGKKMDGFYELSLFSNSNYYYSGLSEFKNILYYKQMESLNLSEHLLEGVNNLKEFKDLKYLEVSRRKKTSQEEKDVFENELKENLPEDCEVSIFYR